MGAVIGCSLIAVVVANLLMTKPVATVFRPIFEPRLAWLFRPVENPAPAAKPTEPATDRSPAAT